MTYPGPQDLAQVTGAVTGTQTIWRSMIPFKAINDDVRKATRGAEADAAPRKPRIERGCMLVIRGFGSCDFEGEVNFSVKT